MSINVFVYGTLLVPEMMRTVTGGDYVSRAATVAGYVRYYLEGRVYPGIAAEASSVVEGRVYLDVSSEALARLDYFEGPEYVRQTLEVALDDGNCCSAEAYVIPSHLQHLLTERPWQVDEFRRLGLDEFLQHARDAMRHYVPGGQVRR